MEFKMITVEYLGSTYQFSRDSNDIGHWTCVKGRAIGKIGSSGKHISVPTYLNNILTSEALKNGYEKSIFVKAKNDKGSKKKVAKVNKKSKSTNKTNSIISIF